MADATPQAPTTPAGDAAAGRDEVVEQAAEFIWDYIHGNWGAYEDVQEMAAGLAERGLLATPPTGDPIFKETAETLNTAAGNASQLEQATPDTELRERYARAIARAMWGAAVNRCDPMPIDWSAADAVMAERDTEIERLTTDQLVLREQVRKQGEKIAVMSTLLRGLARRVGGFRRVYVELARIAGDTAAERDLAVAHDRQPYPTAWAYEQACAALHRTQAELAALRAQQQDMVRLPEDWRERIGNQPHPMNAEALLDSWRASPTSTEDPADTCDCAGEQCAGPREICAAFPTEPESLKAQYSVRSLDYIRELYRVPAEVDRRVIFDGDPGKITGALGPYLLVLLDGDVEPVPVHPTWHMSYAATEDEGGEH